MDRTELASAAQPDAVRDALATHAEEVSRAGHAHGSGMSSLRRATYRGHEINVRTTYEITVDGRDFTAHITVDNSGRVHYHGLPTRDFSSVIGLVQRAIDMFPEDFQAGQGEASSPQGGHHEEHGHGGQS
jgi:hypothetical protein